MVTLFIVIGSTVLQCVGNRWCDVFPAIMFHHMWEAGIVELIVEVPIVGTYVLKIFRRKDEKIQKDREILGDK